MQIKLNGDPYALDAPLTVTALLARLGIDGRRVAVEHNLVVLKRATFDRTIVNAGDEVEVVNFVGGGQRAVVSKPERVAANGAPRSRRGSAKLTAP